MAFVSELTFPWTATVPRTLCPSEEVPLKETVPSMVSPPFWTCPLKVPLGVKVVLSAKVPVLPAPATIEPVTLAPLTDEILICNLIVEPDSPPLIGD